jgi:hypothetical protein
MTLSVTIPPEPLDSGLTQQQLDVASRKGPTGYVPPLAPRKITKAEFRAAVMFNHRERF